MKSILNAKRYRLTVTQGDVDLAEECRQSQTAPDGGKYALPHHCPTGLAIVRQSPEVTGVLVGYRYTAIDEPPSRDNPWGFRDMRHSRRLSAQVDRFTDGNGFEPGVYYLMLANRL